MKKKIIVAIILILITLFALFLIKNVFYNECFENIKNGDCIYVNNVKHDTLPNLNGSEDIKIVSIENNISTLKNISDKYSVKLPGLFEFDFSKSKDYVIAKNDDLYIHISKDRSPYEDTFWYIDYYQNRFYTNESFLQTNNITLHENRQTEINGNKTSILTLTRHFDTLDDFLLFNIYVRIYTNKRPVLYSFYV